MHWDHTTAKEYDISHRLHVATIISNVETWIVWLILTFIRQSIHVRRRGLFPIPREKSDRGFKVEHLVHFLESSGGILRQFLDEVEAGCAWEVGDVFEACFVLISRARYVMHPCEGLKHEPDQSEHLEQFLGVSFL